MTQAIIIVNRSLFDGTRGTPLFLNFSATALVDTLTAERKTGGNNQPAPPASMAFGGGGGTG